MCKYSMRLLTEQWNLGSHKKFKCWHRFFQIVKGDVVIKLGYGEWCDMMIVVKKDDYPKVKQVDDILRDAALAAMGNLQPGLGTN